jgi:hypothetical protein
MAITAKDVKILHEYVNGVMARADHHADKVTGIALALLGAIIWRGEPDSIEIKQYAGNLANVLWVSIEGKRYAFAFNHDTEQIEVRDRTQSGKPLRSFDNGTPLADLEQFFRSL